MDWWLFTFFLGAILSLFLPIVTVVRRNALHSIEFHWLVANNPKNKALLKVCVY